MSAVPAPSELDDLAERIRREATAASTAASRALEHARAAGQALLEAKLRLGHGAFGPWCAQHVGLADTTVRGYMRIAGDWDRLPQNGNGVADLTVRGALRLLSTPKAKRAEPAPSPAPASRSRKPATEPEDPLAAELDAEVAALPRKQKRRAQKLADKLVEYYGRLADRKAARLVDERLRAKLPTLMQRLDKAQAERMAALSRAHHASTTPNDWMTEADYRLLLGLLHPDRAPADRREKFARGFDIVRKVEPYVKARRGEWIAPTGPGASPDSSADIVKAMLRAEEDEVAKVRAEFEAAMAELEPAAS